MLWLSHPQGLEFKTNIIQLFFLNNCIINKQNHVEFKTRVEFILSSLYSYIFCLLCFHIWYSGMGRSVVVWLGGCNICHPFLQPIAFTRQLEMWIVRYKSAGRSLHLVEYRPENPKHFVFSPIKDVVENVKAIALRNWLVFVKETYFRKKIFFKVNG